MIGEKRLVKEQLTRKRRKLYCPEMTSSELYTYGRLIAMLPVFSVALGEAAAPDRWPHAGPSRHGGRGQIGIRNKRLGETVVVAVDADKMFVSPGINQAAGLDR